MFEESEVIDERYQIIKEIGEGGFGKVYEAIDLSNNDKIAIKQCNTFTEDNLKRFKREVRIMKNIHHPNVIKVLDHNLETAIPYFTMPLASTSLDKILNENYMDINTLINYFEKICSGVAAIHSTGHTHRDIKPHNVLIIEDEVIVSDLGFAKFNNRDTTVLTKTSDTILTEEYAPPEQFIEGGSRDLDHRGDIFMLGKTLYQLLTNQRPLLMNPGAVPIEYKYIVQKATQYEPRDRYQSVGALLDAVLDIKRVNDPENNPDIVLKSLISTAEENLKDNLYQKENIIRIINTLNLFENPSEKLSNFNMIPTQLFHVLGSDISNEFEPLLKETLTSVKETVSGKPWSYAEEIGNKMRILINSSTSPLVCRDATLIVLVSAVELNRFAAMDQFDSIILSVKNDEVAFAIAEGLREEISYYKKLYNRIPRTNLHPAIRNIYDLCLERESSYT
ncbi:protein kinase [Pontibacillus yanchengensis]|uniref:non-specific serine/threonine protein kinase n=1 Tax=Pontibacillus yanchengensis TaxID=462910 RepID=A0A6I4ZZG4_9BACI|nr:serine/threonine-protein kinase [Pontibacillus yanchengensis]MYL33252.1 protein kinase [Pontibacillus yanchengensis]